MRVQGEGRLCEKPFSLACSFFTVFLHDQKDGAPQGASHVQKACTQYARNSSSLTLLRMTNLQVSRRRADVGIDPYAAPLTAHLRRNLPCLLP